MSLYLEIMIFFAMAQLFDLIYKIIFYFQIFVHFLFLPLFAHKNRE